MFIKRLTCICVSNILHQRKILPSNHFEIRICEGLPLRVLKPKSGLPENKLMGKWLEGAFEAFDKKYLKDIILEIKDVESNLILEVYKMGYRYNEEDELMRISCTTEKTPNGEITNEAKVTLTDIQLNTMKLLKSCVNVTKKCSELPSQVALMMCITYQENTPHDFEPKGYKPHKETEGSFSGPTRTFGIGAIETNNHFFSLFSKGCFYGTNSKDKSIQNKIFNEFEDLSDPEEPVQKNAKTKSSNSAEFGGDPANDSEDQPLSFLIPRFSQLGENSQMTNLSMNSESEVIADSQGSPSLLGKENLHPDKDEEQMRCVCLSRAKTLMILKCSGCGNWIHADCFGILENREVLGKEIYCHICHKRNEKWICHDNILMGYDGGSDQQKLARLRRVLRYSSLPSVKTLTLVKIKKTIGFPDDEVANFIQQKLINLGVIRPQDKKKTFLVDKEKLRQEMLSYFYSNLDSDDADDAEVPSSPQASQKKKRREHPQSPRSAKRYKSDAQTSIVSPFIFRREVAVCRTPTNPK